MRWTKESLVRWLPNLLLGAGFLSVIIVSRLIGDAGAQAPAPAPTPTRPPAVANPHGDLRVACETCHTAESWTSMRVPSEFDHGTTGFALEGKHLSAACKDCHKSLVFSHVATSCADCHRDVHEGRNGVRCQDCHVPVRWVDRPDAVRRHASTSFPLRGVHALLECVRCHTGADEAHLTKVSSECVGCHSEDYAAATSPNHAAAGYSTRCESCHDASRPTWSGAGFDHASTGFPLTGAHAPLACTTCHSSGTYAGLSADCVACHRDDYDRTTDPNHAAGGFSTQCATCHGTSTWSGAAFDHNRTRFPLTGAHIQTNCTACHGNGQYTGTPTDCIACHRGDYDGATSPSHAGFPTQCTTCHNTTRWEGATFDHATTGFPLTGAHVQANCTACHGNGVYAGTPTDCVACHRADYDGTSNPNHATAGFSTQCATCHGTTTWAGAVFDHSRTQFPLTGAHVQANCTACHGNGVYAGTPTDCVACHRADYDGTSSPNHAAAGFSTLCTTCHGTSTWAGATFDHNQTQFPLTGAHVQASCTACHGNGVYNGTPTDCVACHRADYDGTSNPNHAAAGFSTVCTTCHGTSTWAGATFNHDLFFRIYSGRHREQWNTCTQCHQNPASYQVFSCFECHGQSEMDSKHRENPNYRYDSNACYNCHRDV